MPLKSKSVVQTEPRRVMPSRNAKRRRDDVPELQSDLDSQEVTADVDATENAPPPMANSVAAIDGAVNDSIEAADNASESESEIEATSNAESESEETVESLIASIPVANKMGKTREVFSSSEMPNGYALQSTGNPFISRHLRDLTLKAGRDLIEYARINPTDVQA
jgi:hypothetical protein